MSKRMMWKKFLCVFPYEKKKGITYDDFHPPLGLEVIAAASRDLAEEVLEISKFAQALKLDFLRATCLKAFKYSGLREEVEKTPGYHIGAEEAVYSDTCSLEEFERLRKQVLKKFFSPVHIVRIARKFFSSGVPKSPFLKFMTALVLSEFAGRGLKLSVGRLA